MLATVHGDQQGTTGALFYSPTFGNVHTNRPSASHPDYSLGDNVNALLTAKQKGRVAALQKGVGVKIPKFYSPKHLVTKIRPQSAPGGMNIKRQPVAVAILGDYLEQHTRTVGYDVQTKMNPANYNTTSVDFSTGQAAGMDAGAAAEISAMQSSISNLQKAMTTQLEEANKSLAEEVKQQESMKTEMVSELEKIADYGSETVDLLKQLVTPAGSNSVPQSTVGNTAESVANTASEVGGALLTIGGIVALIPGVDIAAPFILGAGAIAEGVAMGADVVKNSERGDADQGLKDLGKDTSNVVQGLTQAKTSYDSRQNRLRTQQSKDVQKIQTSESTAPSEGAPTTPPKTYANSYSSNQLGDVGTTRTPSSSRNVQVPGSGTGLGGMGHDVVTPGYTPSTLTTPYVSSRTPTNPSGFFDGVYPSSTGSAGSTTQSRLNMLSEVGSPDVIRKSQRHRTAETFRPLTRPYLPKNAKMKGGMWEGFETGPYPKRNRYVEPDIVGPTRTFGGGF